MYGKYQYSNSVMVKALTTGTESLTLPSVLDHVFAQLIKSTKK